MRFEGLRRGVDGALVTVTVLALLVAAYATRRLVETIEPVGPLVAVGVVVVAVGTVVRWWDPTDGVVAAWVTALGPIFGFSVFLTVVGPRLRWVYPDPQPLLGIYGASVVAWPIAVIGIGVKQWSTSMDPGLGTVVQDFRGRMAVTAAVGAGIAFLGGVPTIMWWPAALSVWPALGSSVLAATVAGLAWGTRSDEISDR